MKTLKLDAIAKVIMVIFLLDALGTYLGWRYSTRLTGDATDVLNFLIIFFYLFAQSKSLLAVIFCEVALWQSGRQLYLELFKQQDSNVLAAVIFLIILIILALIKYRNGKRKEKSN